MKHCRDCEWLCGDRKSIGIRCTNTSRKKHKRNNETNEYKYPSCPICKTGFKAKEEKGETVSLSQPVEEHS